MESEDIERESKGFSIKLEQKKLAHPHKLSAARQEQYNVDNMVYIGTLWMGSSGFKQDVVVVFDTGSDWLIVEVANCETCTRNKYDPSLSSEYHEIRGTYGERSYGSLHTTGHEALDTVCFTSDQNHCLEQFRWFAVTYQDGGLFKF